MGAMDNDISENTQPSESWRMTINRDHFKKSFSSLPGWICSECQTGTMREVEGQRLVHEPPWSRDARDHEAWDPDWISEDFAVILECQNPDCAKGSVVSGTTSQQYVQLTATELDYELMLHPSNFTIAPLIFKAPNGTPDTVIYELDRAFHLFWSDTTAAANKIRNVVEAVLTQQKVKRTTLSKKNRRVRLNTHGRIKEYEAKKPEQAELLMGLKWVGNANSHVTTEDVSRDELLNVFELCEHALVEIYKPHAKQMKARAAAYTKRKGRPAPAKKRRRRRPRHKLT